MVRKASAVAAVLLFCLVEASPASPVPPFEIRVDEAVPIVLAAPVGIGGFTLSEELPPGAAARVRVGMTVRRK